VDNKIMRKIIVNIYIVYQINIYSVYQKNL